MKYDKMLLLYTTLMRIEKSIYILITEKRVKMAYYRKSQADYNNKCNRIYLKYTEKESIEYNRINAYCKENGFAISTYIKELIKKDMNSKNVPYNE